MLGVCRSPLTGHRRRAVTELLVHRKGLEDRTPMRSATDPADSDTPDDRPQGRPTHRARANKDLDAQSPAAVATEPELSVWPVVEDFTPRLQMCFTEKINPKTGNPWTLEQVSAEVKKLGGTGGVSYFSTLRAGKAKQPPSLATIVALTILFEVEDDYFTAHTARVQDLQSQMRLLKAVQDADLLEILLRLNDYTEEGRRAFTAVLNGLDTVPGMRKAEPSPRLRNLLSRKRGQKRAQHAPEGDPA